MRFGGTGMHLYELPRTWQDPCRRTVDRAWGRDRPLAGAAAWGRVTARADGGKLAPPGGPIRGRGIGGVTGDVVNRGPACPVPRRAGADIRHAIRALLLAESRSHDRRRGRSRRPTCRGWRNARPPRSPGAA